MVPLLDDQTKGGRGPLSGPISRRWRTRDVSLPPLRGEVPSAHTGGGVSPLGIQTADLWVNPLFYGPRACAHSLRLARQLC